MVGNERHLKRSMGVWTGISIVIGTVIGSGIFFKQGQVLETAGSTTGALWAWIAGGVVTLAAGLTISEIGAHIPQTGGIYTYMEKLYGKFWGFLTGWTQVVVYAPAIVASISAYFAYLFANFFGLPESSVVWIGLAALVLVTAMNSSDNRIASMFQVATTSIKLIPIAVLMVFGLFFGKADALGQTVSQLSSTATGNFGMAVLATLFAYDGWATLTNLGGELKDPRRNIPRSIIWGVLIVMIAYVGVSYGVYRAMPADQIVKLGNNVTFEVAKSAFGELGGRLLSVGILVSMAGTLNGKMLAFPRMVYAMSHDGVLPKFLGTLNKAQAPVGALWTTAVLAGALMFTSKADWLSDMAVFVIWLFYTATFFGIFILRARNKKAGLEKYPEVFSVPLFPFIPLVAILGALFILVNTLISSFTMVLISFIFVGIGVPVYLYYKNKK
ncbi:APC family permease [Weissella confusa]|uniref:Serine/threonine protein kinase n=1 Tax=Weissella confusa TaxID=1583 RepID=A0A4Z0S651_WEICO|nr:amino acid permease [Weissella confusa]TGE75883.1 serine/threonine protein kinase [Weissella confusa]